MDRRYDYRPKWTIIILCALFFGAGALLFGAKANGNDRGLIIDGIVELTPGGATIFFRVLMALSAGFVVLAAFLATVRLTLRQQIGLSEKCLIIPRSRWASEEMTVPFGEILKLSTLEVSGQRFLMIVHKRGKFTLTASMLPKKQDFDEICEVVTQGVKSNN